MSNILIVSQHYYPENFRITDIAEELVKKGHSVTVLCGYPNYPEGNIYPGYKNKKTHAKETINGVNIIRCYEHPRKKGAFHLFWNYYSVCLSMKTKAKKLKEKFDLVLINQLSPVMVSWAGIAYAKKHKVPCYMYCYDLWPASLAAGGIKPNSIIYKYYKNISKKIYKSMDKILVTSHSFIDYLSKVHDIDASKMVYLPQYCEDIFNQTETQLLNDEYHYVFAGNVGKVQSVETIIKAANRIKDDKNIFIHIVGDGSNLDSCKKLASDLSLQNVIFHGRLPLEDMPEIYSKANAMIVTLIDNELLSKTLPGKVQSYMCAGKPIIGAINGETKKIIDEAKCGLICNAESDEELAKLFIEFKKYDYIQMSNNALKYYKEYFMKELFFEKLLLEIGVKEK